MNDDWESQKFQALPEKEWNKDKKQTQSPKTYASSCIWIFLLSPLSCSHFLVYWPSFPKKNNPRARYFIPSWFKLITSRLKVEGAYQPSNPQPCLSQWNKILFYTKFSEVEIMVLSQEHMQHICCCIRAIYYVSGLHIIVLESVFNVSELRIMYLICVFF